MIRYLSLAEILDLHRRILSESGGMAGIRDLYALEASIMSPYASFDQQDIYPDVVSKAAALSFSVVMNHPFVDGNKRVGHAAMEVFLILNGQEISCCEEEQEQVMLDLAAGRMKRDAFKEWVRAHSSEES